MTFKNEIELSNKRDIYQDNKSANFPHINVLILKSSGDRFLLKSI